MHAAAAPSSSFVDLAVQPWHWAMLLGVIVALLTVDLFRHRHNHEPTTRAAVGESLFWVFCGVVFGGVLGALFGGGAAGEYFTGYVIEKSLSIDNVFVWAVIFSSFAIPSRYQHRVLFWGIFGALLLRAAFIFAGTAVLERFWWMVLVFGVILVVSGVKIVRHRDDEGEHSHDKAVGWLKRFVPVTDEFEDQKFFVRRVPDGASKAVRMATPLFAALLVVEVTDVVFAFDSVPAILAVSREPYVVFASNAFAILGLRALYFLLASAKDRFHYLSHALGGILVFVGAKMMASHWWHMPTALSLGAIFAMLVAAVVFSELRTRREASSVR